MTKTYRHHYIIGDLQGCFSDFTRLLDAISFDERQDKLWLAGDLVARGEDSLSTLRHVKYLNEIGCANTVLGNHDITLLAVWRGVLKNKKKDNTSDIFSAPDCDELLEWLRHQPLFQQIDAENVLTHAGIPPHWTTEQAKHYAKEVEIALQANLQDLDKTLPQLYRKLTDDWYEDLQGYQRLRAITNYLTRMRLCDKQGNLEFSFKAGLDAPMPNGFKPWFEWQTKVNRKEKIFFGHWAALQAMVSNKQVQATDAGCVWGGTLNAYRLADGHVFSVD